MPFNSTVQFSDTNPADQDFNFVQSFEGSAVAAGQLNDALSLVTGGGETNYFTALSAAGFALQANDGFGPNTTNTVYFLSDGVPFPNNTQPPAALAAFSAQLKAVASIHAVGVGDLVPDTTFLDPIDNTGGAEIINAETLPGTNLTAALTDALSKAPAEDTLILSAELRIFNGTQADPVDTFFFTGDDFDETQAGFELDLVGTSGFDPTVGKTNKVELTIELDGNGDGIAGSTITFDADIDGIRPLSFDA